MALCSPEATPGSTSQLKLELKTQTMRYINYPKLVLAGVFTLFNTSTPKLFAEIDRVRAQAKLEPLKGERPVEMVAWESFGEGWVTDAVKQLKLDATMLPRCG